MSISAMLLLLFILTYFSIGIGSILKFCDQKFPLRLIPVILFKVPLLSLCVTTAVTFDNMFKCRKKQRRFQVKTIILFAKGWGKFLPIFAGFITYKYIKSNEKSDRKFTAIRSHANQVFAHAGIG